MPCTVTDADETMDRDSGISSGNNNETDNNSDSMTTNNDLSASVGPTEVDSVVTEAATATAVVLPMDLKLSQQGFANTVAEELAAAAASVSMSSSAVTLETLSEDGSVGIGGGMGHGAGMHHQMHHQMHHHSSGAANGGQHHHHINHPLLTPTSPRSVTTASMSASDDMVENENETLRDRVSDLEKRVHDQNDEITCLRATLADALRRINSIESTKGHVQINHVSNRDVRLRSHHQQRGMMHVRPGSAVFDPNVTPTSDRGGGGGGGSAGSNSGPGQASNSAQAGQANSAAHDNVGRRASYASNRDKYAHKALRSTMYQSTGSLHSDNSSNSMSPAPSPSPTHLKVTQKNSGTASSTGMATPVMPSGSQPRNLSGSMSNLSLSATKRWGSTSDFREPSPGPNASPNGQAVHRRLQQTGSMGILRSPYGSQSNLDRSNRHGTKEASFHPEEGYVKMFIRGRPVQLFVPEAMTGGYALSKVSPAPHVRPKLEWVYGYRGRDARSNLYLLPTGEIVYFVAAVVVLFNAEEHSQRHYMGHTEDIRCLAVHPNKLLIATGQATGHDRREGKPHIRIWNSVSLITLHVLGIGELERAVVCISFSKADGGNLLVAVDEGGDHTMSVWDWQRGEKGCKITETKCATETVVAAEFHPLEAGVIVSVGKGHVNFWTLDNTTLTLSRKTGLFDLRDKPKYVTCLAFSFTGDVLTGDSNGNVFIWGRGYNAVTKALRNVHEGPIFSICVLKDGSIVTGGGKDRKMVQFDSTYRKSGLEATLPEHLGSVRTICQGKGSQFVVGSTRNSILQGTFELNFQEIVTGHVDEVWALSTHPSQNQFLTAGYDNLLHLWDTLTHRAVWSSNIGDQAQSACFSKDGEVIVIAMSSGKWMVLDSNTREIYGLFQDGVESLHTVRFSPDGKFLVLGSRDGILYIYQVSNGYKKYHRMGRCLADSRRRRTASSGSLNNLAVPTTNVTHVDWSADSTHIQCTSGDCELSFWNATVCRQVTNPGSLRDVEWATQSCLLSFNTIGIWPETMDGTDLSTCAKSNGSKLMATGDDFGKIKVYSFPVTQPKSLHHTIGGHSSHVTRVEFLADDSRLISTGGRDTAIMQWNLS